jgi:hypothetical protein
MAILAVMGLLLSLPMAAQAQSTVLWDAGGDAELWDDPDNWNPAIPPGEEDLAVFPISSQTVMNLCLDPGQYGCDSYPGDDPYLIDSIRVDASGYVEFTGYSSGGYSSGSGLSVLGDFWGVGSIYHPVGSYVVRLGTVDGIFIGDNLPEHDPVVDADTWWFNWELLGSDSGNAFVGVTGYIGIGDWDATYATIMVGFQFTHDVYGWDAAIDGAAGVIDGNYPYTEGNSDWHLDGVLLFAKRARDLGDWTVTSAVPDGNHYTFVGNYINFREGFEVNRLTWTSRGGWNYRDEFNVRVPDELSGSYGLHVLDKLDLGAQYEGPSEEAQPGPDVKTEHLEVHQDAELIIHHGTLFRVHEMTDTPGNDGGPAPGGAIFRTESSLRYGPTNVNTYWPETPIPYPTEFTVVEPLFTDPPTLLFEGDSFITSITDPDDEDFADELFMTLAETSFEIQAEVSEFPAREWYTGSVDLLMKGAVGSDTLELIAQDNCQVWFVDVPEPRCLKYWRNYKVVGGGQQTTYEVILVDEYDNHVCGTEPDPPDGALYIAGDLLVEDFGNLTLSNPSMEVYYGGDLDAWNAGAIRRGSTQYTPIPLVKSVYGDFDGDCCVGYDDYYLIYEYATSLGDHCDWPVADYNGNCSVDLYDVAEVLNRASGVGYCYENPDDPDECPGRAPIEECPFLGGGDGPEQGGQESEEVEYLPGMSPEAIAALGDAIVAYLVRQDPRDSGEEDTVQHMIDSFDKLTAMYFDGDQKGALADALEQADYASDTVVELTAALVTKLRG